jgi:hypothetical protein
MIQRRCGLRFPLKAATGRRIGEIVGQNLDRNVAIESVVMRLVDFAHSSGTNRGPDLVGTKADAWREAHRGIDRIIASTIR